MAKTRTEKKSETLEVRLPHSKKEAFKAACEAEGITASHAVRTFIDAYLKQSRRVKLKRIAEDITMRLMKHKLKTAGMIGAGLVGATMLATSPSVADTNIKPISAPTVVYPAELAEQGIGAACQAKFDVTAEGLPEDIKVTCTHPGFIEVTRVAAASLRFQPKTVEGVAVRARDVVYPITYQMNDEAD